jgi:hypothetical protein
MLEGTRRCGDTEPGVTVWLIVTRAECKDGRMSDASRGPWYWCLTHGRVEPAEGCANIERMGPFETRDLAATALDRAAQRTKDWDEDDARWTGGS